MNDTASSNPVIAKNKANGTNVTNATNNPPLNNWYKNVDKIFINVCPAVKEFIIISKQIDLKNMCLYYSSVNSILYIFLNNLLAKI